MTSSAPSDWAMSVRTLKSSRNDCSAGGIGTSLSWLRGDWALKPGWTMPSAPRTAGYRPVHGDSTS
jgi:hypothetical protein